MDWLLYIPLPINALAASYAFYVSLQVVRRGGARVWVNVYAMLIMLYVAIIYTMGTFFILPNLTISPLLRWIWTPVSIYIVLNFATERRGRGYVSQHS